MILGLYQSSAKGAGGSVDRVSWLVQQAVRWPAAGFESIDSWASGFLDGMFSANSLSNRVLTLEGALAQYRADRERIESLRRSLDEATKIAKLPAYPTYRKVPAHIVGYFPEMRRLMLNVGSARMIKPGAPVIANGGLVGQVVEVSAGTCFVNLVNHSDFSVGARIVRGTSQEAGIATGQASAELLLSIYTEATVVNAGDMIQTSGLSTIYPEGLAIGFVTKVWQNKTLGIQEASVAPAVHVGRIRHAVVLVR